MKPKKNEKKATPPARDVCAAHLRFGWWSLVAFLMLGMVLEGLHGFKVPFYMDVANDTRRLLWTLAHAHGTLLSLINVAFALTAGAGRLRDCSGVTVASRCLLAGTLLLPAGFFLGGMQIYGGDPGIGILLVPAGAVVLLVGVGSVALSVRRGA